MNEHRNLKSLGLFIGLGILAMGFGGLFTPGQWYANLVLAPWTPPNIVFPIVWSVLYLMIALSGWIIFAGNHHLLKQLWVLQLILNTVWSWLFFGKHWVGIALIDILILDILVFSLIVLCIKSKLRSATWLLVPYFCWISLATSLNAYVVLMN